VFANGAALLRLAGSLLIEQNDEWLVSRRYLSEASMAELTQTSTAEPPPERSCRSRKAHRRRWCDTNLRDATLQNPATGGGATLIADTSVDACEARPGGKGCRVAEGTRRRGLGRNAPSGAATVRTGSWARNGHPLTTPAGGRESAAAGVGLPAARLVVLQGGSGPVTGGPVADPGPRM
jgi:hypothetical protein